MTHPDFIRALQNRKEISITVKGRRSGRAVRLPVWFTRDGDTMWLLPLHGSRTQWYRNVLADPAITVRAGRRAAAVSGRPSRSRTVVRRVLAQFRGKYGAGDVARYYDHTDVAVALPLATPRSAPGTRSSGGHASHGRQRPPRSRSARIRRRRG